MRLQGRQPMRVAVFRQGCSGPQLLGSCTLPALGVGIIEVLHSDGEADIARGTLRPAEVHRFAVMWMPGAAGGQLALVPQDGARPEVLPAWQPARPPLSGQGPDQGLAQGGSGQPSATASSPSSKITSPDRE